MNISKLYIHSCEMITVAGEGETSLWHAMAEQRLNRERAYPAQVKKQLDALGLRKSLKKQDPMVLAGVFVAEKAAYALQDRHKGTTGVLAASARGAAETLESQYRRFLDNRPITLKTSPLTTGGVLASTVAREMHLEGLATTLSSACTTSLHAVSLALGAIHSGLLSHCLVVGSESANSDYILEMLARLKVTSKSHEQTHRSFCEHRQGMLLTQGAAAMLLSQVPKVIVGHSALISIAGVGNATESQGSATGMSPVGLKKAILDCLKMAGSDDVDVIVGHGSATALGDQIEIEAYRQVFDSLPSIFSSKWVTGHPLAASGLLGIATALGIFKSQSVPEYPENLRPIHPITRKKRPIRQILVTALGFGGGASAVLLRQETH